MTDHNSSNLLGDLPKKRSAALLSMMDKKTSIVASTKSYLDMVSPTNAATRPSYGSLSAARISNSKSVVQMDRQIAAEKAKFFRPDLVQPVEPLIKIGESGLHRTGNSVQKMKPLRVSSYLK